MHEVSFEPNSVNWKSAVSAADALDAAEEVAAERWLTFSHREIVDALDEAMHEYPGAPRLVWRSFWDRLTDGGPIPERRTDER